MADLDRLFSDLGQATRELKDVSADLDGVIGGLEQKLASFGIDFELWLMQTPLDTHDMSVSASNVSTRIERQLGYAPDPRPAGRGSILCIRRAEVGENALSDGTEVLRVLEVIPLTEADSTLRIAALRQVPALIEALTEHARSSTEVIGKVRDLADGKR